MRVKKIIERIEQRFRNSILNESLISIKISLKQKKHKVLYMGVPTHPNMGDQAQALCILQWIKSYYPNSDIIEFPTRIITHNNGRILKKISKYIANDDLIIFQSGYTITDLYPENEKMHHMVLLMFPDNAVVFLPQTIFFSKSIEGQRALLESRDMLRRHKNILLLCRDRISYQQAIEYFPTCKILLYPDIVTTQIGHIFSDKVREGVVLCLRNDKEKYYSDDQLELLYKEVVKTEKCMVIDTTLQGKNNFEISRHREKYFRKTLSVFSKAEVIITDRYHGVIFALITNTPVIVLKTSDHKLTSGVEWYQGICDNYICLADSIEDALKKKDSINRKQKPICTKVFMNYYAELRQKIDDLKKI